MKYRVLERSIKFLTLPFFLFGCNIEDVRPSIEDMTPKPGVISNFDKNVILIMTDDLGIEAFDFQVSSRYKWKNLRRLSNNGVIFNNAYATPLCATSRASILTGQYNSRNYQDFNNGLDVTRNTTSLAKLFRKNGYLSGAFGKCHVNHSLSTPYELGFDTYTLYAIGNEWADPYYGGFFFKDGVRTPKSDQYGPDVILSDLLEFITANREGRFFAYYPMLLPHTPWQKTPISEMDLGSENKGYYPDMVDYIDVLLGKLLDSLENMGILQETLIVFTSDNGSSRGVQTLYNGVLVQGGKSLTIGRGIHVPLVVYTGRSDGIESNDIVGITDYYATFYDLLNTGRTDSKLDGHSLASYIYDQYSPGSSTRKFNYIYFDPKRWSNPLPKTSFAFTDSYKLYEDGSFYNTVLDSEELFPISESDLTESENSLKAKIQVFIDSISATR